MNFFPSYRLSLLFYSNVSGSTSIYSSLDYPSNDQSDIWSIWLCDFSWSTWLFTWANYCVPSEYRCPPDWISLFSLCLDLLVIFQNTYTERKYCYRKGLVTATIQVAPTGTWMQREENQGGIKQYFSCHNDKWHN